MEIRKKPGSIINQIHKGFRNYNYHIQNINNMINMSKELKRPENMSNNLEKNMSRCERKTNRVYERMKNIMPEIQNSTAG